MRDTDLLFSKLMSSGLRQERSKRRQDAKDALEVANSMHSIHLTQQQKIAIEYVIGEISRGTT